MQFSLIIYEFTKMIDMIKFLTSNFKLCSYSGYYWFIQIKELSTAIAVSTSERVKWFKTKEKLKFQNFRCLVDIFYQNSIPMTDPPHHDMKSSIFFALRNNRGENQIPMLRSICFLIVCEMSKIMMIWPFAFAEEWN